MTDLLVTAVLLFALFVAVGLPLLLLTWLHDTLEAWDSRQQLKRALRARNGGRMR